MLVKQMLVVLPEIPVGLVSFVEMSSYRLCSDSFSSSMYFFLLLYYSLYPIFHYVSFLFVVHKINPTPHGSTFPALVYKKREHTTLYMTSHL